VLQNAKGPVFIATPAATKLDDVAMRTYRAAPNDIARLGFAVAHRLDSRAAEPEGLSQALGGLAAEIVSAMKTAKRPLVMSGPGCGSAAIIEAAANVAWALPGAALAFTTPECNSMGLTLMDARPLEDAFVAEADTLIVLENDLYRRAPATRVDEFLSKFSYIVALDTIVHHTTNKADLILPAAAFSEGDGTLLNNEGRAQRFFQAFLPAEPIQDSWRWLGPWRKLDDVLRAFADEFPALSPIIDAAPLSDFRINAERVPREPHRYSGRTAMHADINVHEPRPPQDQDSPLSFSMEGTPEQPPPALIPFFWSPGWNSIQAVNKFQGEIAGPLRGGPSGVRLIKTGAAETPFYRDIPAAFQPKSEEWLVIALHHIFSSEELARRAPAVSELSIPPYVALNPEDAAAMGPEAEILGNRLPVRIVTHLPRGVAGLLVGVAPFEGVELPGWHRIVRIARAA